MGNRENQLFNDSRLPTADSPNQKIWESCLLNRCSRRYVATAIKPLKSPLSTPSLKLLICRPRLSTLRGRILQIFNQNSTIQPPAERGAAREMPRFFLGVGVWLSIRAKKINWVISDLGNYSRVSFNRIAICLPGSQATC